MEDNQIKSNSTSSPGLPELPALVKRPVAWVPTPLKAGVITRVLNVLFANALLEGELDFLDQRTMNVTIRDAGVKFSLSLENGELCAGGPVPGPDLSIEGTAYTFLQLATRKEDADTLFFRRQLKTSGDTELGLYVKNFLDGLEPDTLPGHRIIDPVLRKGLHVAERVAQIRR
jgi:predicted lipid carrier protein YhbT